MFKLYDETEDGKGVYRELALKGKKQFLVNAGSTIRKDNAAGLNTLDLNKKVEAILDRGKPVLLMDKSIIPPGKYRTPGDGIVEVAGALGSFNRDGISKGKASKALSIKGTGKAALEQFAQLTGHESLSDLLKNPAYKAFAAGKFVTLHMVQPIRASYFTKAARYNNVKGKKLAFTSVTESETQEVITEKECK